MSLRILLSILFVAACFPAPASNFTNLPRDVKLYLLTMVDPESRSALAQTSAEWYDKVNKAALARVLGIGWTQEDQALATLTAAIDSKDFTDEVMAQAVALFIARGPVNATSGDFRIIDRLVRQGAVIPEANRDAVLTVALKRGYFDMVLGMMFVGQLSDAQRLNALVKAAGKAPLHTVQLFLSNEFNVPDDTKRRVLVKAAAKGRLEVLTYLVGAWNPPQAHRDAAQGAAARSGQLEVLRFLLGEEPLSQELRETLVRFAALGESVEVIRYLLASGPISERCRIEASESAYSGHHQWAILAEICDSGPLSARQLGELLWSAIVYDEDRVVLALARNNDFESVLSSTRHEINRDFSLRVRLGRSVLVKTLLDAKIISPKTILKALEELSRERHPEIAVMLINALAEEQPGFALRECIKRGFVDMLHGRLDTVPLTEEDKAQVLVAAAESGNLDVMKMVLQKFRFMMPNLGDALFTAVERNHLKIVELLLTYKIPEEAIHRSLKAVCRYQATESHLAVVKKAGRTLSKKVRGALLINFAQEGIDELVSALYATGRVSAADIARARAAYIKRESYRMPAELFRHKEINYEHQNWVIENTRYYSDALKAMSKNPRFTAANRDEAVLKLVKRGCSEGVKILLDDGDISTDTLGQAICRAVEEHDDKLAKILLSAGTYLVEPYRSTALKMAKNRYNQEIYQLLNAHPNGWFSANMVGIVGFGILVALVCLEGKGSN